MGFKTTFRYDGERSRGYDVPATRVTSFWPLFEQNEDVLDAGNLNSGFVRAYAARENGNALVGEMLDGGWNMDAIAAAAYESLINRQDNDENLCVHCPAGEVAAWARNWLLALELADDNIRKKLFGHTFGQLTTKPDGSTDWTINPGRMKFGIESLRIDLRKLLDQAEYASEIGVDLIFELAID